MKKIKSKSESMNSTEYVRRRDGLMFNLQKKFAEKYNEEKPKN